MGTSIDSKKENEEAEAPPQGSYGIIHIKWTKTNLKSKQLPGYLTNDISLATIEPENSSLKKEVNANLARIAIGMSFTAKTITETLKNNGLKNRQRPHITTPPNSPQVKQKQKAIGIQQLQPQYGIEEGSFISRVAYNQMVKLIRVGISKKDRPHKRCRVFATSCQFLSVQNQLNDPIPFCGISAN